MLGPDLQHVRQQLRDHGHDIIQNGVKAFVWASQFGQTMDAFWRFREERSVKIMTSHIIVSHGVLPYLEAALQKIPSQHKVRAKKNGHIELPSCRTSPCWRSASSSQNVFSEDPAQSQPVANLHAVAQLTGSPSDSVKEECGVEGDPCVIVYEAD